MNDIFKEQLVKRKNKLSYTILVYILYFLYISLIILISLIVMPPFQILIVLIGIFVLLYIRGFTKVEYEYIITNGEIDIDCIYNKKRRKRLYTFNIKEVMKFCKVGDESNINDFKISKKIKDCSNGNIDETYKILLNVSKQPTVILISFNEELLKVFKKYLKRDAYNN